MCIVARLREFLPVESVLAETEAVRPFECDGLSAKRQLPLAVVLPETLEQVQQVLKLCSDSGIPVVARGAGTGLSGGACPVEGGIVLSLTKFNRILEVNAESRYARVQAGVRNLAISEAVARHGLYYAPDPSSQIACSIGGNVGENSGGVHCLKYGLTVNNVLGLKVVTIDGELLEIGGGTLDSPGYDLLALLNGSEGLLGVVVEVTVRLLAIPAAARLLLAGFSSVDDAARAVASIIAQGIVPAGLEMMDQNSVRATEAFVPSGYPVDAAAVLLCEVDGTEAEAEAQITKVRDILVAEGATELRVAKDEAERNRFWTGRKSAFPAVGRLAPDYFCMDGTIPRKRLAEVLGQIAALAEQYQLLVPNVFHAGDGNLHPLVLFDANEPGQLERAEELGGRILELCVAAGGTVSGEHGVGIEKLNQMCVQFSAQELQQFHDLKAAFDPAGLLNPGKAVPTLSRCAEIGGMHVHAGKLPFPDLERF